MGAEQVIINEVAAPQSVLHGSNPFNETGVPVKERQPRTPLSSHQPVQDEQATGLFRVDPIETDAATIHHRKAMHRDPLGDHRPTRPRVPFGIAIGTPRQRTGRVFHPLGLDLSDSPRAEPVGLNEFGRHHPRSTGAREH